MTLRFILLFVGAMGLTSIALIIRNYRSHNLISYAMYLASIYMVAKAYGATSRAESHPNAILLVLLIFFIITYIIGYVIVQIMKRSY